MPVDPAVLAALRAALDADPSSTEVRAHLAALLLESGDTDGAWEQARVVLATQPDHLGALDVAAAAGEALGESDAAAAYRRLLDALSPGEPALEPDLPPPPPAQPMRVTASMPDTADELLEQWAEAEPLPEPDVGTLASPSITLADVGGLDAVKERLELSFLAPLRHPELRLQFGKSKRGGLVLWGPPGCGKTYIAKAVAGELGANFYEVGLADVLDMWIGSSERNLRSVFEVARSNRPCVLFFDEVDALGHKRTQLRASGGAMRGVVNQFLTELDGATNDNEGVFVLAATNHPWDSDPALLRPGRFDRKLLVGPPDQPARAAILATHLRGRPTGALDLGALAAQTDGYSGADLALVCEQATEAALAASIRSGAVERIGQQDLQAAVRAVRPSTGPWFDTARNFAQYSNEGGEYDELLPYLKGKRRS
jgi:SpoVK/Ycf46/Vps4 family AAA+-type ATPase